MKQRQNANGFSSRYEFLGNKPGQKTLKLIEMAGRTCYRSEDGSVTPETTERFVRMLIKKGHESVLEHEKISVKFFNVSRGLTHELVRHRIASFSQESTRFVDYLKIRHGNQPGEFELRCVIPPHKASDEMIELEDGTKMSPFQKIAFDAMFYRSLRRAGWATDDARQFLPIATGCDIVLTANIREWRYIMKERTQKAAHWEIRSMMCKLLADLKQRVPVLFEDFVLEGQDNRGYEYYKKVILV